MPDSTRKSDEELKALLEQWSTATPGRDEEAYGIPWYEYQLKNSIKLSETGYKNGLVKCLTLIAASRNSLCDIILDLQASRERERELVEALKEAESMWDDSEFLGGAEDDDNPAKSWRAALARAEAKEKQP